MAERAAHLIDHVFPRVPVRQWVLSLPHRLRYRLAWGHTLCRAVVARTMRAIRGFLRRRAREDGVMDGRSGAVVIVQRFGGALNLNVHFHALVLDAVFARRGDTVAFHPCPPLDAADVDEVLATVTAYIGRLLAQGGSGDGDEGGLLDERADEAPVLAGLAAASVQGQVALGSRATNSAPTNLPEPADSPHQPDRGVPRRLESRLTIPTERAFCSVVARIIPLWGGGRP
jgi:hypothetical protein